MTEKITPQTYIDMNKEFEKDGTPLRIVIPTQEQIDKHRENLSPTRPDQPKVDMVQQMWEEIGIYTLEQKEEYKNKHHIDRRQ